jgi:hypothetical protein
MRCRPEDAEVDTKNRPTPAYLAVALTVLANDLMALVPEVLADRVNQARRNQLADTVNTLAHQLRHDAIA